LYCHALGDMHPMDSKRIPIIGMYPTGSKTIFLDLGTAWPAWDQNGHMAVS